VPIHDIREQLADAAGRVLLRDGPDALTSRAVTTEAGVAKGILHRYFRDFDGFLAAFVLRHIERLDARSRELRASAGTGDVADNVVTALVDALDPIATQIVALVIARRPLLERLRLTTPTGVPLLVETTKMIATYLTAERGLGRIALNADVDTLAVMLVGGAYVLAATGENAPADDIRDLVSVTIHSVAQAPPRPVRS
jgi:AcrR family transcriptional regulator